MGARRDTGTGELYGTSGQPNRLAHDVPLVPPPRQPSPPRVPPPNPNSVLNQRVKKLLQDMGKQAAGIAAIENPPRINFRANPRKGQGT